MIEFNYEDGEEVSSPTVILSGNISSTEFGVIRFTSTHQQTYYEIHNSKFKALVNLAVGENSYTVEVFNGYIDNRELVTPVETSTFKLNLVSIVKKPIHLCLIVASDSQGKYDMPQYKLERGEVATLESAVQKLQVVGRLMQAYTHDEMKLANYGNRTFDFVEESGSIKVHILKSDKSRADIQNVNWAQQNKHATDSGGLFSHAMDLIKRSSFYKNGIQVACIYLDSKWDPQQNLILGHAALGGGSDEIKLAIFGSHGLHSWPNTFKQVIPCFLDDTKLYDVANDNGDCDTSCQTFNTTAGAFLHEIGHLLGCPHQNYGVMLRDYIRWNRSFVSRLNEPLCHWHPLDLIRFLYHDSFSLPEDTFDKVYSTKNTIGPAIFNVDEGILIKSTSGIYLVEACIGELAKYSLEYSPDTTLVRLNYLEIVEHMKPHGFTNQKLIIRILTLGGNKEIDDFKQLVIPSTNPIESFKISSDFGLGKGQLTGYKSELLGRNANKYQIIGLNLKIVDKVRVYHGMAIDGIRFCNTKSDSNNAFEKMFVQLDSSMMFGNQAPNYSDFELYSGEVISKFHIRSGWWVDGLQIETSSGRKSPWYGNDGGNISILECPTETSTIVGMYGFVGKWLDGIGIVYTEDQLS